MRPVEKADALAFGSAIHDALQLWYTLPAGPHRLLEILDFIDARQPATAGDPDPCRAPSAMGGAGSATPRREMPGQVLWDGARDIKKELRFS